ncbi:MAG: hypothetical protein MRJ96_16950 [Nitrospirales bacterium]|nr:hypothetical protein [Nitrospira sp.]MDR4503134.1 hypothetical protein [Nitrospirales bacterium]
MRDVSFFTKDNGKKLPVSDEYLLPFLSPTSPGTNYWDSPPPGPLTDRQRGRIFLQVHQALQLFQKANINLKGKKLLDIGTGNGMIPRLLLEFSDLDSAVGADPFLNEEHKTSWQGHDQDAEFQSIREFIRVHCPDAFEYEQYRSFLGYEHFSLKPDRVPYTPQPTKTYRFAQIGAHDLAQLDEKFDLFYVKAIDHIPNWDGIFKAVAMVANKGAVFCIKHFSFFSYLGPHRYATTNIPWGHLLLTNQEYRRFASEFHPQRAKQMTDFFFTGLAYPRHTMSNLIKIARRHGFIMQAVINEPLRNINEFQNLADEVDGFWQIVEENWPDLSAEEMMSGRYHILLRYL